MKLPPALAAALPPGRGVNLDALPPPASEADFQRRVIALAESCGWRVFSLPDSRRVTCPGWPDLVLAHERWGVVFAELKTDKGKVSGEQRWWHERLRAAGCRVEVWRPGDWYRIKQLLEGGEG